MPVSREQFIVDDKGRKTKVVLPIKDYEKLLEDLHDLAVVAAAEARWPPVNSFSSLPWKRISGPSGKASLG